MSIPKYLTVDRPTPHVEFVINYQQASHQGGFVTYTAQHRFSEFLMLHELLLPHKASLLDLPDTFPSPKRVVHTEAVLQERRQQ